MKKIIAKIFNFWVYIVITFLMLWGAGFLGYVAYNIITTGWEAV